jgi:hypothetical protein
MHALLGLSASHLSKLSPASFSTIAQHHRLKASEGLNEALCTPIQSVEKADTVIAACHALLFQSWYMDDGLIAFLVLTRSCALVSHQVRSQNIQALLAKEDLDSRTEVMKERLEGTPIFSQILIYESASSLQTLSPLCLEKYQQDFLQCLLDGFASLSHTSAQGLSE